MGTVWNLRNVQQDCMHCFNHLNFVPESTLSFCRCRYEKVLGDFIGIIDNSMLTVKERASGRFVGHGTSQWIRLRIQSHSNHSLLLAAMVTHVCVIVACLQLSVKNAVWGDCIVKQRSNIRQAVNREIAVRAHSVTIRFRNLCTPTHLRTMTTMFAAPYQKD